MAYTPEVETEIDADDIAMLVYFPAALSDAARWVARFGRHAILALRPSSPTSRGGVYRATVNFALGFPAHVWLSCMATVLSPAMSVAIWRKMISVDSC